MGQTPLAPPPGPPPGIPGKRKTNIVVWILLGIAGFIVVCGLALLVGGYFLFQKVKQAGFDPELMQRNPAVAVTKILAALDTDVEVVSVDEARGVVIVRNKRENKVYRLNFEDLKQGKIVYQEEGKEAVQVTVGQGEEAGNRLPAWFPDYPGMKIEGSFALEGEGAENFSFAFKTGDPVDKVAQFFTDELQKAGWKVNANLLTQNNVRTGGVVEAQDEAHGRSIIVSLSAEGGQTTAAVTVTSKK